MRVDHIARSEGLIEFHVADDIAQGGCRQIFHGHQRIFDTVGIKLWIGDLKIDDRVDLHGDIIFGNDGLRRKIRDLFF